MAEGPRTAAEWDALARSVLDYVQPEFYEAMKRVAIEAQARETPDEIVAEIQKRTVPTAVASDASIWAGDMSFRERVALALHDACQPDDTGYTLSERMASVHGGPQDSSYMDAADMILATGHFDIHPSRPAVASEGLREALERLVEAQNTLDRAVTDEQMVAAVNGLEPAMKQARAALAAEPADAGLHKHKFGPTRVPASVGVRLCLTCGAPEAATPVGEEAG